MANEGGSVEEALLDLFAQECSTYLACVASDGRIAWATRVFMRALGLGENHTAPLSECLHPDDRERYRRQLERPAADPPGTGLLNVRVRDAHGHYRRVHLRFPAPSRALQRQGVVVILDPVDPLPQGDDPLSFWSHGDHGADVVYEVDDRAIIRWVLPSVTKWLGWTADQMVGRSILDFIFPDDLNEAVQLGEALADEGHLGEGPHDRPPLRLITADGGSRWMAGTAVPQVDDDGRVISAVVTLRDVNDLVEARLQAEANVQQWRATVDSMLDPFVVLVPTRDEAGAICDFTFTLVNAAAAEDQHISIDEMVGKRFLTLFPHLQDEGILAAYAGVLETGDPLILDDVEVFNDVLSESRRYDIRAAKAAGSVVLTWRDITERHLLQKRLTEQEAVYRIATESAYDAVVQLDDQGILRWASPSFQRITGHAEEDLVGTSAYVLIADDDMATTRAEFQAALSGRSSGSTDIRIVTADGVAKWVQMRMRAVSDDSGDVSLMVVVRDIDADVVARKALERSSRQDPLTGVATWRTVREQLQSLGNASCALLCIGVDRLRAINEAVTYAGGDVVLIEVVNRIASEVPPQAIVGRITGNEFVVAIPDLSDRAFLTVVAEQIVAAVAQPVAVAGQQVLPSVSIGVTVGDDAPDELLRRASLAARAARTDGGGCWRFDDPATAAEAERRLWVESQLRTALSEEVIQAWFQPVVRLRDRKVMGYEALARWPRGAGQVLPPSEFLDVAEASGLVVEVDFAILQQALQLLAVRRDVSVSVNVSARTLVSGDYARRVLQMIERAGVDPARLRLEVTETALQYDHSAAIRATTALAIGGVKWWLDDFGTGYSTLTHLRDYPISGIKLDRSFTVGVGEEDLPSTRLARALLGMAKGLGLETVAEGVEDESQMRRLGEQGWQNGQGWLFGKPEPLT